MRDDVDAQDRAARVARAPIRALDALPGEAGAVSEQNCCDKYATSDGFMHDAGCPRVAPIVPPPRVTAGEMADKLIDLALRKMFAGRNVLTADAACERCGGSGVFETRRPTGEVRYGGPRGPMLVSRHPCPCVRAEVKR